MKGLLIAAIIGAVIGLVAGFFSQIAYAILGAALGTFGVWLGKEIQSPFIAIMFGVIGLAIGLIVGGFITLIGAGMIKLFGGIWIFAMLGALVAMFLRKFV